MDFSIKKISSENILTDSVGCIVLLNDNISLGIKMLVNNSIYKDIDFCSVTPHITLYHAFVKNLPLSFANDLILKIDGELRGKYISFDDIYVYGSKFIFWNVKLDESLNSAHLISLKLAKYFDKTKISRSIFEGLSLNKKEKRNINIYGYPLVKESYKPHLTLGYFKNILSHEKLVKSKKLYNAKISAVKLAIIGDLGKVNSIINVV